MAPVNLRAIAGAPHRSFGLLSPASARSTASCGHSWKIWEIVSWPFPHHQAGSTSGRRRFSYERRARWCPHRRRARCTRSCRCRSASSGLTGGGASPRRVLTGALAKALATKLWWYDVGICDGVWCQNMQWCVMLEYMTVCDLRMCDGVWCYNV